MMNPPMPLSKSASAVQVISVPDCVDAACTLEGGGGGVESPSEPVLTYSIHALATVSFGIQTASAGSPLYSAAGRAAPPIKGASHALLESTGLRVCSLLPLAGSR